MARRRTSQDKHLRGKVNKESLTAAAYIFKYIRPYRGYFIAGMVLLALGSAIFMVFPFLAGQLVDIAQGSSTIDISLKQAAIALGVLLIVQGSMSYLRVICFAQVSERGLAALRKDVFDKVVSLPMTFFEGNKTGELISRITGDIEKLQTAFSFALAEFLRQIIVLIIGIAFLVITTPRLAWIMLATVPVIVVGAMYFGRIIRKRSSDRQDKMAESNDIISDAFQAIQVIKTFTNEWKESARYGGAMAAVVKTALHYARGRALFAAFIITVLFGALFMIIWQGAMMIQEGSITAGALISFVAYTAVIGGAIAGLGNFYTDLLGALGATERIRAILQDESEVDIRQVDRTNLDIQDAHIQFEEVSFTYPSRPDVEVLSGLTFHVAPGQTVALVGPSGAGKSTVVHLLLRTYHYDKGRILMNGEPIESYDMLDLRSLIATVSQEVVLFSGTIQENIRYGRPAASDEEVRQAADAANALEFIDRFPDGMQTLIGERGVKLSGGQRQRLAIARAILNDPLILILDEATSNLDSASEGQVQEALERLMRGRTSIVIAHRLSTIQDADRILVLRDGRLEEAGQHGELLAADGLYAKLVALQTSVMET